MGTAIIFSFFMLLVGLFLHLCTVSMSIEDTTEQLTLPMPLDDGTRNEMAVYSIETEVE